jgi:hypothetical protein
MTAGERLRRGERPGINHEMPGMKDGILAWSAVAMVASGRRF